MGWKEELKKAVDEYPSDDELNDDPDFNRAVAPQYAAELDDGSKHVREITADLSKWVLTSLQAINAGGAVAVTQANIGTGFQVAAGIAFVFGLSLPLISAHLSVMSSLDHQLKMGTFKGYWQAVAVTGFRQREQEVSLVKFPSEALAKAKKIFALGWASAGLFFLGAIILGAGLWVG